MNRSEIAEWMRKQEKLSRMEGYTMKVQRENGFYWVKQGWLGWIVMYWTNSGIVNDTEWMDIHGNTWQDGDLDKIGKHIPYPQGD